MNVNTCIANNVIIITVIIQENHISRSITSSLSQRIIYKHVTRRVSVHDDQMFKFGN